MRYCTHAISQIENQKNLNFVIFYFRKSSNSKKMYFSKKIIKKTGILKNFGGIENLHFMCDKKWV